MLIDYCGEEYLILDIDNRDKNGNIQHNSNYYLLPIDKITLGKEELLKDLLNKCIKVSRNYAKSLFTAIDFDQYHIDKYEVVKIDVIPKEPKLRVDIASTTNNHTYHISNFIMRDIASDEDVIDILASEGYFIDDENITSISATVFYKDFSGKILTISEYNSTRE